MRIVSYNILDGGTGRLDALAAVIARQRPDVVGLVEADDEPAVAELARRLGMDFVLAAGKKKGSALLSPFDIVQSVNYGVTDPSISRSYLEAVVVVPRVGPVPVGVVHLHSRAYEADEQVREREVEAVLRTMAAHRRGGVRHFLCGDFNANAPTHHIDLEKSKPKTRHAWEANGGRIPRRAIARLLAAGYVDTLKAAVGEAADVTPTFTTDHPGQRVDFVFAWGVADANVRDAWVDRGEQADAASDHYPVGADVVLEE